MMDSDLDKDKPLLSHTVSLPSPIASHHHRHSSDDVSSAADVVNALDATSAMIKTKAPPQPPQKSSSIALPPTTPKSRSKSVREKKSAHSASSSGFNTPNRVWSFGNMARAVGCGVTAFGSNVVESGKAVGSGVYNSSKAAGRATLAAGKGVVQAGEMVSNVAVNTGRAVSSEALSAMRETTEWVIEQAEMESQVVHVVLPGEDLSEISKTYRVPTHKLIKANSLKHRRLLPGKQIIIPKKGSTDTIGHPMDTLTVSCWIEDWQVRGYATFTLAEITLATVSSMSFDDPNEPASTSRSSRSSQSEDIEGSRKVVKWKRVKSFQFEKLEELPELLPAEDVDLDAVNRDLEDQSEETDMDVKIIIINSENKTEAILKVGSSVLGELYGHVNLWYPEKIETVGEETENTLKRAFSQSYEEDDPSMQVDIPPLLLDELVSDVAGQSRTLSRSVVEQLHTSFSQKMQSTKWELVFSTVDDGFSMQNFYRKVCVFEEPFLLSFLDSEGLVFGAFLTCVPVVREEFSGTGESWLFSVERNSKSNGNNSNEPTVTIHQWSKENEYFFQGKPNCMIMGASDGKFGIFIDGNFHHGRIDRCGTFENWPAGGMAKDIKIRCFECFRFT